MEKILLGSQGDHILSVTQIGRFKDVFDLLFVSTRATLVLRVTLNQTQLKGLEDESMALENPNEKHQHRHKQPSKLPEVHMLGPAEDCHVITSQVYETGVRSVARLDSHIFIIDGSQKMNCYLVHYDHSNLELHEESIQNLGIAPRNFTSVNIFNMHEERVLVLSDMEGYLSFYIKINKTKFEEVCRMVANQG